MSWVTVRLHLSRTNQPYVYSDYSISWLKLPQLLLICNGLPLEEISDLKSISMSQPLLGWG